MKVVYMGSGLSKHSEQKKEQGDRDDAQEITAF